MEDPSIQKINMDFSDWKKFLLKKVMKNNKKIKAKKRRIVLV